MDIIEEGCLEERWDYSRIDYWMFIIWGGFVSRYLEKKYCFKFRNVVRGF